MKKLLVVGVIVLFLGVSVIPSTGTTDVKQITVPTAKGDTLYVGGNGPGNYSKIQDAINDSSDGDTIFVYHGTYYENIEVYNSIDLVGEDRDNTFIVGFKENKNTVRVFRNNTNISGFTIYNGNRTAIQIASYDYTNVYNYSIFDNNISFNRNGIITFNSYNIMIYDNIIENNTYYGISMAETYDVRISTNIVSNNDIGIWIYNWYNEAVTNYIIEDNVIKNNRGRGVLIDYCKGLLLVNNSISYNNHEGVSIYSSNHDTISNNSINNNQHQGIHIIDSSNLTISWNNISNNNWTGIHVGYGEYHSIMHNLIQYNEKGVYFVSQDNGNFNNNTIIKNRDVGIDITNSYYNNINHNNFMDNGRQASFFFSKGSNWNGNYWNRPRNLPKLIFGYGLELMILGKNIYITIPWFNFDWHPAKEPYDIGV